MRKTSHTRGWRQTSPAPSEIGPLLRKAGFIGCDEDPIRVRASFDRNGRPRRIHARYAGGWTCCMNLCVDGGYSLSQSIRIRVGRPDDPTRPTS